MTVLNAAWNPLPDHTVAAYGYFHDQPLTSNFTGFANNSYRVYGARDFGDLDFGREADLGVTWAIRPNALLRLQHARYDPGSGRADPEIRKTWLTLTWTY